MPAPPFDMSVVSPAMDLPSGSLTASGVATLMRTALRRCTNSRATAVQTPRITTLKQHHMTFISTVPRRVVSQMKNRGMATMSPAILNKSMTRKG